MKINFTPRAKDPNSDRGLKVDYGAAKRGGYRWQRYLIAAIIIAPFLLLAWMFLSSTLIAEASGQVMLAEEAILAPESGIITPKIDVKAQIKAGHLLGTLDINNPTRPSIDPTLTRERLQALTREQGEITTRLHLISVREAVLKRELAVYRQLFKSGAATRAELRSAEDQWRVAYEEHAMLETSSDALTQQIKTLTNPSSASPPIMLYSSIGGVVQEIPLVGWVERGTPLFRIVNPNSEPVLELFFHPNDIKLVKDGSAVLLKFSNGDILRGTIDISLLSTTHRNWRQTNESETGMLMLKARIRLDNPLSEKLRVHGLPFTVRLGWRPLW